MQEIKKYIESFFFQNKIQINSENTSLFENYLSDNIIVESVKIIKERQKILMSNWELKNRIQDIILQPISLPNGTVNKKYEAKIDFIKFGWNDIVYYEIKDIEEIGFSFNKTKCILSGNPLISGDLKFKIFFRINGEAEGSALNEKEINIIINPDPKSLWKNIESDVNDVFWKEDNVSISDRFVDKNIVVTSKRGRSHANIGSFREDDFAFKNFEKSGWSIICVADGAGSASLSRRGSYLACNTIIKYFEENFSTEHLNEFDKTLLNHHTNKDEESIKKNKSFCLQ